MREGFERAFLVTGGGAMHLNDALSREKGFATTYMHHEQAIAFAAEGYFRASNKTALINVTSGPGGLNALTGVFGAFVDSVPMMVLSGQVRTETINSLQSTKLRQLGDQEADICSTVKSSVKYFAMPVNKQEAVIAIHTAMHHLTTGRPGPVWIDIPINIQGLSISDAEIERFSQQTSVKLLRESIHPNQLNNEPNLENLSSDIQKIIDLIRESKRPLFLVGNGVRISGQTKNFLKISAKLGIPVVTGWNAHDIVPNRKKCYAGKPGTVGDRAGNFAVRSADLVIVLGCRLNIRQISYNWDSFAPKAMLVMIDIDKNEIEKTTLKVDLGLHYNLKDFLSGLKTEIEDYNINSKHLFFRNWCNDLTKKFPISTKNHYLSDSPVNPYAFFNELYLNVTKKDTVVLGNGSACVMGLQSAQIVSGLRVFTNSGCASMGYDLPASIGASLSSRHKTKRTICVTGDGSIMQNIQELITISYLKLPIKIFVLDNNGYHSIRQTQTNYFPDNISGTNDSDGLGFPQFKRLIKSFGINTKNINSIRALRKILKSALFIDANPCAFIIRVDKEQLFEPKLQSRISEDGEIVTPQLHDMYPFLTEKEINENIILDAKKKN